jgi:signal transduction histidine kinase
MQKIWNYISNLGIPYENRDAADRSVVFSNQLNFVLFVTMVLLLITTVSTLILHNDDLSYGTLRVASLMILVFINLILAKYGFNQLSKLSLIYLPPVVFLLGPTMIGYVEEESYTYYPYVLICGSILPQLLLNPKKEKFHYWFSLSYYLVLVLLIDKLMVYFETSVFPIVDRINTFYAFYKIAQLALFLFINASIFYLRNLNFKFEDKLNRKNKELDLQNIELLAQKEEIERQKDELINKEVSTWQKLVNIISHEIVNSAIPITNLAGMTAQLLEDENGHVLDSSNVAPEVNIDIHHGLKIIETRTQGLINFVKATKSLTQIPKPLLRTVYLSELTERVVFLYKSRFKEARLKFECEILPPDLCINADLELMEQVIINLIQNALEAMRDVPEPTLTIKAQKDNGHIIISVSDNGTGIDGDVIEKIFLPFYSTKENNSGIGLSLSQQIMMLHNARLEVSSTPSSGATFTMVF